MSPLVWSKRLALGLLVMSASFSSPGLVGPARAARNTAEAAATASGDYPIAGDWSIALPGVWKRRLQQKSLVLWRGDVTAWIIVWDKPERETKIERLAALRADLPKDAFDLRQESAGDLLRFSYRLKEEGTKSRAPALYSFVIGECGHVQMAIYFDDERDVKVARGMWRGLKETRAPSGRCRERGSRSPAAPVARP